MNTLTQSADRRHTANQAVKEVLATARRIGQGRVTLEDLKTLHAYRDLTLNYEHHVAVHELSEREHLRQHNLADDADELHRLRTREGEETDETRGEQEQVLALFDPTNLDLRCDDMMDVTGVFH